MNFEIGVVKVFFQLSAQVDRSVFQLWYFDSRMVLVLPRNTKILNDVIGLSSEYSINFHSTLSIRFRHLKEVTCGVASESAQVRHEKRGIPKMLINPWLRTWNRLSRSKTRSRKTVMVISFSGSFSIT